MKLGLEKGVESDELELSYCSSMRSVGTATGKGWENEDAMAGRVVLILATKRGTYRDSPPRRVEMRCRNRLR